LDGELGWLAALDSDLDLIDAGEAEWRAADAERLATAGSGSDAPGLHIRLVGSPRIDHTRPLRSARRRHVVAACGWDLIVYGRSRYVPREGTCTTRAKSHDRA
jgi:hypothetical protein